MSYVTVEVDFVQGRIVPREPAKLPDRGTGLLTVLEGASGEAEGAKLTPMEAFHALQRTLNLDDAKAKAWMATMRDARR